MKKLTPKQTKIKDTIVSVLQILIVIVAITISAIVIANPITSSAEVSSNKIKLLPVLTHSMEGNYEDSFNAGDLVIAETPDDVYALEVNDIITYVGNVNGYEALITHRIVEIHYDSDGVVNGYITLGDAESRDATATTVSPSEVLAVYKYHIANLGTVINWLQVDTHFLLVIVFPLLALFIYNIILFVRMILQAKMDKLAEQSANNNSIDEEEIKRKAIEDYLAQNKIDKDKTDKE
jgi:signal peptidase